MDVRVRSSSSTASVVSESAPTRPRWHAPFTSSSSLSFVVVRAAPNSSTHARSFDCRVRPSPAAAAATAEATAALPLRHRLLFVVVVCRGRRRFLSSFGRGGHAEGSAAFGDRQCPPRSVLTLEMMRRRNTANTAQCRVSRASLEATGRCHRASTHVVLPRRTAGSPCRKKTTKKHHTCRPFCWPWRSAGTIPSASPDRGGPGLLRKPLVAVIGQVLRPIKSIGQSNLEIGLVFEVCALGMARGWTG